MLMKRTMLICALYGHVCPLGSCDDPTENGPCFVDPGLDPDLPYSSEKSSAEQLRVSGLAVDREKVVHALVEHEGRSDEIWVPRSPKYDVGALVEFWHDACSGGLTPLYVRKSDWMRWNPCKQCRFRGGPQCDDGCAAAYVDQLWSSLLAHDYMC